MLTTLFLLIVNAIFVITALVLSTMLVRAGSAYMWAFGDVPMLIELRWKILKLIIILVAHALTAITVNLILA
jgi:hypothetical protein